MKVNPKSVIFILVVLAVGAIFIIPYFNNNSGNNGKPGTRQFTTTPNPVRKLNEAKANKQPVYLEFYAVTWPACRQMEPVVLALEEKYDKKMAFITADTNKPEGQVLGQQFGIYYIPAIYILDRNGQVIASREGFQPYEKIEPLINKAIKSK